MPCKVALTSFYIFFTTSRMMTAMKNKIASVVSLLEHVSIQSQTKRRANGNCIQTHQKVFRYRLLGRHASTILRRRVKDPIPPPRRRQRLIIIFHPVVQRPLPLGIPITPRHRPAITRILAQLQYRRDIPTPVAVVRCRPDRHNSTVKHLLIPLHDQLVGARDE